MLFRSLSLKFHFFSEPMFGKRIYGNVFLKTWRSLFNMLRAEVKILKAEKERAEMEASFLKKLEEIERRRG